MKLQGKKALMTGRASGIGLAIAEALLAKGASVAITGRRPAVLAEAVKQLSQGGHRVESIAADVSTDEGRKMTLKLALESLGGLDILVNNAGGVRAGRLEDTTEAEIRAMIEVDLVAPILLTRAALPALRASKDGLVVNVTVTGGPDGDRDVHLAGGHFGRGHAEGAPTKLTVPYDVAKDLFIEGNPSAAMQAFMGGKIKVEGDITKVMALQSAGPPSEEQAAFQARIQAMTA